jgi:hypothetical protein
MKKSNIGALIILIAVLYEVSTINVNAYTISRNRILKASAAPAFQVPHNVTLDQATIGLLNSCHAPDGAAGYQAGYDDACDWMLGIMGIRAAKFKSRPSVGMAAAYANTTETIQFRIWPGNYVLLNGSTYKPELITYGGTVLKPYESIIGVKWFEWLQDENGSWIRYNRTGNFSLNETQWRVYLK